MENEDKKNDSAGPMKVVYDIMPGSEESSVSDPAPELRIQYRAHDRVVSNLPEPVTPRQPANRLPSTSNIPTNSLPPHHSDRKWYLISGIIFVITGIGVGAYFIFFSQDGQPNTDEISATAESVLTAEWLKKYFALEACTDRSVCGDDADPDNDGFSNSDELNSRTDPLSADSDSDGISDADEVNIYSTEPLSPDTDGDGFEDGSEIRSNFSPTQRSDKPIAPLQKQQFDDALDQFGQHEPTPTFLQMKGFTTRFLPAATSTPQVSFNIPKDWVVSKEASDIVVIASADGRAAIVSTIVPVASASTTADTIAYAVDIRTKKSPDVTVLNPRGRQIPDRQVELTDSSPSGQRQRTRISFLRRGFYVFSVSFSGDERFWQEYQVMADTVLNSIR